MRLRVRAWLRLRVEVGVRVRVWLRLYKLINKTLFKVLFSDDIFSGFWAPRATHPQSPPRARPRRPTHRPQSRSYAEYPLVRPCRSQKSSLRPPEGVSTGICSYQHWLAQTPNDERGPDITASAPARNKNKKGARGVCVFYGSTYISLYTVSPEAPIKRLFKYLIPTSPAAAHGQGGTVHAKFTQQFQRAKDYTQRAHVWTDCGRDSRRADTVCTDTVHPVDPAAR